jgi:hypothetical protein
MVALRAHDDLNGHPIMPPAASTSRPFLRLYNNTFSGFGFHPGLRRTLDYLKIAPFQCAVAWPFHFVPAGLPWFQRFQFRASEIDVHKLYNKFGNSSLGAVTIEPAGYVKHTGESSSTGADLPFAWVQEADDM